MAEIATAFVRVRPNMEGFKSETEAGVKSGFSNLAKIVGIALGAAEAFKFGKDIVQGAATLQKSVEAIRAEFGAASESVVKFGEQGAQSLGASAQVLDATSSKFGTLFKNLGIGAPLAAQMTKGFETLAGSIATIRDVKPETLLSNLPLAASGSARALKQLGVVIDQNQLKAVAAQLGFGKLGQALTPAQRSIAIYTIATQHLGDIQAQAQRHAGDFANQQARLSAEWSNAKDSLGAALLPALAKLTKELADRLPGAVAKVKAEFKTFVNIVKSVTGPIGGVKGAIVDLLAAFAVVKILAFAKAIRTDLIANGLKQFKFQSEEAKTQFVSDAGVMRVATVGLAATIKGALISTGIGAIGIAIGFAAQYIITHWAQVKRVTIAVADAIAATWRGLKEILIGIAKVIGGTMATYLTAPLYALLKVAGIVGGLFDKVFGTHVSASLKKATSFISRFSTDLVKSGLSDIRKGGGDAASALVNGFKTKMGELSPNMSESVQLANIKAVHAAGVAAADKTAQGAVDSASKNVDGLNASLSALNKSTAAGISTAQASITNLQQSLATAIRQEAIDVTDAVTQAKQNLQSIMSTVTGDIGQIIDAPLNALSNRLGLAQNKLSLENLRRSTLLPGGKQLSADPKKALAELHQLLRSASTISKPAVQAFILQWQQAHLAVQQSQATITKDNISKSFLDLADSAAKGKITPKQFRQRFLAELKGDHVPFRQAGALLGTAFLSGFHGAVKGLFLQLGALKGFTGGKTGAGDVPQITKPLVVLHKDQMDIQRQQRELAARQHALGVRQAKAAEKAAHLLGQIAAADKIIKSSLQSNPGLQGKISKGLTRTK